MDERTRSRFLEFSRLKYRGAMDCWLDELVLTVLKCDDCGHVWYHEQPDQAKLLSMYDAAVPLYPNGRPDWDDRSSYEAIIAELARVRRVCGMRSGQPTLLDFGSGFGRWPRAAVDAGFRVSAFEPSRARGHAADVPFELVHELDALRGRTFDAVNVEQVLEHVPDPVAILEQIRTFCAPMTLIRITVPNFLRPFEGNDVWAVWPFDGTRTHTLAPFEHLHGFTPRSLDRVIVRAGFRSAPPALLWRYYPVRQIRTALGRFLPRIGTTFRIVRLAAA
jgi:SAM-dependent methyltransferase